MRHLAWVLWALAIAAAMLLPSDNIPQSKLFSYDKIGHLGVYMILTLLLLISFVDKEQFIENKIKAAIAPLTICIVYGSILEFLQQYIPGRASDWYDFLANTSGAVLGTIVFVTFSKLSLRLLN